MPNNIQIILDGKTAITSGNFNELASRADSISPNRSSKNSTESASSNQSSSNEDNHSNKQFSFSFASFLIIIFSVVAVFYHEKGRRRFSQNLTAQLPDGKIFAKREYLRKEEEKLNDFPSPIPKQEKELAEKIKALDKKELAHLRQRVMVLEGKLETQEASIETVRARESPHEAVNTGSLPDETHTKTVDDLDSDPNLLFVNEEMGLIKRAIEALKSRERELEAQVKDGKKRIQELNAPKSNHVSSIACMLLGSALAFGVTMVMSVARQQM
ncbi:MAG: hypothetical protein ASARMPRED_001249 [Alectoria sarmentosa]|nr:MAG: hypothetical protein ASARMPRED_001249 [Alectoria sarmentosa]